MRWPAEKVNTDFVSLFRSISAQAETLDLYADVLNDLFKFNMSTFHDHQSNLQKEIDGLKEKITEAMDIMMEKEISSLDFKTLKSRYEEKVTSLERKKIAMDEVTVNRKYVLRCTEYLKNLEQLYVKVKNRTKKAYGEFDFYRKTRL